MRIRQLESQVRLGDRAGGVGLPETASCAKRAVGGSASHIPPCDPSSMAGKNRFLTPAVPISGAAAPWLLDGVMKMVSLNARCNLKRLSEQSQQMSTQSGACPEGDFRCLLEEQA